MYHILRFPCTITSALPDARAATFFAVVKYADQEAAARDGCQFNQFHAAQTTATLCLPAKWVICGPVEYFSSLPQTTNTRAVVDARLAISQHSPTLLRQPHCILYPRVIQVEL